MADAHTFLALAVQHTMARRGITPADLAARLGVKHSELAGYISGRTPGVDVARLCEALGVTAAALTATADNLGWRSAQAAVRARVREMGRDGN